MSIAPGTRFGPYAIVEPIGQGGMGEVYRATDTNLKRDVAIKILPQAFADDADRVARFQREAEALAALNHPHIAQIYGLERSAGSTAIVMELVEGPTLAERIAVGPMNSDEALGVALQVASALEAAHGQGIVHRDLKPANVKLRADGTVKVLDFGIATAPESAIATSGRRSPVQLTPALTEAGILLGTAAYMSPEQARGRPVDERADIWAFGCLLYEMLTGQPAFAGEDVTTTLARVLEREASLQSLPASVPAPARQAIALCLEKDPAKRIADIRDLQLVLTGRLAAPGRHGEAPAPAAARPFWRRALPLTAALLAGGGVVGLGSLALRPEPAAPQVLRFTAEIADSNQAPFAAISRDGSLLAFRRGDNNEIQVRKLAEFAAKPIPGTGVPASGNLAPCFSPDGIWIAYSADNGSRIRKQPLTGGAALPVAEGQEGVDFCDWGEDGYIYFGTQAGIARVAAAGGNAELVAAFESEAGETSYEYPRLLPGGRLLLFTVLGSGGIARLDVAVLDLETRVKTVVLKGAGFASYARTGPTVDEGHIVYGRDGALFAVPFNQRTLAVGPASPVLEGVMGLGPIAFATIADNGTLVYFSGAGADLGATLRWVDRSGAAEPLPEPQHIYGLMTLASDGRRAAVDIFDIESLTADLWVYEFDGERLTRLTFGGINQAPVWSRDNRQLFYSYTATTALGDAEIRVVATDNSSPPATLGRIRGVGTNIGPRSISPDGAVLIGWQQRGGANGDIWALRLDQAPIDGSSPPAVDAGAAAGAAEDAVPEAALEWLLATDFNERDPELSPDGRFLAYTSNESGRDEVYVVPYPGPGGKTQVSVAGGRLPRWNPNGRELFYVSGADLMAVAVETGTAFRRLTPGVLFSSPQLINANLGTYAVAGPDGDRLLMPIQGSPDAAQSVEIRVIVNWFEELRALAPGTR